MKQIMELFSQERKARKKEISKLKTKLQEKETQVASQQEHFMREKDEIVIQWKQDTQKHQEFYHFITKKVNDQDE
jgi:hypothetical protein